MSLNIRHLIIFFIIIAAGYQHKIVNAQCDNCNSHYPAGSISGSGIESSIGTWSIVASDMSGGDYAVFHLDEGYTYEWSTCNDSDFDTQLSLFHGVICGDISHLIDFSDDDCGTQSKISFTAPQNMYVAVLLSESNCQNNSSSNMELRWRSTCSPSCGASTDHGGADWTISSDTFLGGTHTNVGTFTVNSGVTIELSCHTFQVEADNIIMDGTIIGTGKGGPGGIGGFGGDDASGLDGICSGGSGGLEGGPGSGTGAGFMGTYGLSGQCEALDCGSCTAGLITGGGGAGGASGGAFNGHGGSGGGGAQAADVLDIIGGFNGSTISTPFPYGDNTSYSINYGSGGGGGGGGGGGYYSGQMGGSGGNGGGKVVLIASNSVNMGNSAAIFCDGTAGKHGGYGSGASTDGAFDCYSLSISDIEADDICPGACNEGNYYGTGGAGGGAGGGSGGGIMISSNNTAQISATLDVSGGTGGDAGSPDENDGSCFRNAKGGGGGSGGRIKIFRNPCLSNVINPTTYLLGGLTGNSVDGSIERASDGSNNLLDHPSYAGFDPGDIASDQTICEGGDPNALVMTTNPTGGIGTYTYQWWYCTSGCSNPPVGYIPIVGAESNNYDQSSLTQTTYYSLSVQSGSDECKEWIGPIEIDVKSDPVISISATNTEVCEGENITLTASLTGGNGTCIYQWQYSTDGGSNWNNTGNDSDSYSVPTGSAFTNRLYRCQINCDGEGCDPATSNNLSITVAEQPEWDQVSISPSQICEGGSLSLTASVINGLGGSISWQRSPSGTGSWTTVSDGDTPPLGTWDYQAVFTPSGNGCSLAPSAIHQVSVKDDPSISISADNTENCLNESITLTASANGGSGNCTYQWQYYNGSSWIDVGTNSDSYIIDGSEDFNNRPYRCLYSCDGEGCDNATSNEINLSILENPSPSLTANPNPICEGQSSNLSVSVSFGQPPYTYQWNQGLPPNSSHTVSPTSTTTYQVSVTDANGCEGTAQVELEVREAPDVNITADPDPVCNNESATLTANVSGGTSPYTFNWSNSMSGQNISVSPNSTTTYTVTVTDINGCQSTASYTLNVNLAPSVSITASPNPVCSGEDLNLTANVSGGTSPYSYAWNEGLGGGSNHTLQSSSSTTYEVTVTDANGCTGTAQVDVTVNELPDVDVTADPNPICYSENVSLTASGSGGNDPYLYDWSNGLGSGPNVTDSPDITTTYIVTVTDNNACTNTGSVTVTVNDLPVVTATGTPNPVCDSEPVLLDANASEGTSPYSYEWDHGLGVGQQQEVIPTSTTDFNVTVTDDNGCTASDNILIVVNDIPGLSLTADPNPVCDGETTTVEANISGTPGPFSYAWNQGLGDNQSHVVTVNGETEYAVTVTDGNGCMANDAITVTVHELPVPSTTVNPNPVCSGENISLGVSATGGTPSYSYEWADFGSGANQTANPASSTGYVVTVTDANNCTASTSANVTVWPLPNITVDAEPNPSCSGSPVTISAEASGASTPYMYEWSNGLGSGSEHVVNPTANTTYTVSVTDSHSCSATENLLVNVNPNPNVSITASPSSICDGDNSLIEANVTNGQSPYSYSWDNGLSNSDSHTVSPSISTTYHLTVTDANGCLGIAQVSITVNELPSLTTSASPPEICNGQSSTISANASGGSGSYTFSWDQGLGSGTTHSVSPGSNTTYTVSVSDGNSCSTTSQVTLTVHPNPNASIQITPNPACFGDDVTVNASVNGGTAPYSYNWNYGLPDQASHTLTPGTSMLFFLTVSDVYNCSDDTSQLLNVNPEIVISIEDIVVPTCYGDMDASFEINVAGGSPPYDITWTNGSQNGNFTNSNGGPHDVTGITAGTYEIDVTDAQNCTAHYEFTITQPNPLNLTISSSTGLDCYGDTDGSATLQINGGTPDYNLTWDNGSTSNSLNNLSPGLIPLNGLVGGTYQLTLTDANGCTMYNSFTINEPSEITIAVSNSENVSCNSGSDGSFTLNISGGSPFYEIQWSGGGDSGTDSGVSAGSYQLTGLSAGTYNISLTDSQGCTETSSVIINEPATPLSVSLTDIEDCSCVGTMDGSAEISVSGGVSPYDYNWNHPNGSGNTITNVTAGDYYVTVTDDWGCSVVFTVTIDQPDDGLSASETVTAESCPGNNDGSISINASGGTPPYSYTWSPDVSSSENANNLSAGTYNLTINDAGTCVLEMSINVPVNPNAISAVVSDTEDPTCYNGSDGSITVTASNGNPPYSYQWQGIPNSDETAENLSSGTYYITVSDIVGCSVTLDATLIDPPQLQVSEDSHTNVDCYGNSTGNITVTASGGTPPYTYHWEDSGGNDLGINSPQANNLSAGTYFVSVSDANGCGPATAFVTITQPAQPLSVNVFVQNNPSCNGGDDGSLITNVSGGTSPYTYDWDNPISSFSGANPTNLEAGTYSVTVYDANNCSTSGSVTMNQPDLIQINSNISDVSCYGGDDGSILVTASSGISPYDYYWEDNGGNSLGTSNQITNLEAGVYYLTVNDDNGCELATSISVSEPSNPVSASLSHADPSTYGNTDGYATATPSGGSSPYSYEWEDASNPGVIISTNATADNLSAGTYCVTVTDDNGCTWSGCETLNQPPDQLSGQITQHVDVACAPDNSGALTASGTGGTPPYDYYWENPAIPFTATTPSISNLEAGDYSLTITDDLDYTWDTTITISQPPLFEIASTDHTDVDCPGDNTGNASINVTGGVPAYDYEWSPPISSFTSYNPTQLTAGTYTVTVTDDNGCSLTHTFTITDPEDFQANFDTEDALCYGSEDGSISATISGGSAPYSYDWEDEGGSTISGTDEITGLEAGTYYLTVTDDNGCTFETSASIGEPTDAVSGNIVHTDASTYGNNDGSATVTPSGGTPGYSYSWEADNDPGNIISTGATANNLSQGYYSVTVTDANGCTWTGSVYISHPDDPLDASITEHIDVLCAPDATGALTVVATGGTPPYTYFWENAGGSFTSSQASIENLPADDYTITITDQFGYTWDTTVTISQAPLLEFNTINQENVTCPYGDDGSISVSITGGAPPYSFAWDTGDDDSSIDNLTAGFYNLTVTDQNDCELITIINITQPEGFNVNTEVLSTPLCNGTNEGSATLSVTGGTPGYDYLWDDAAGTTTPTITELTSGYYNVNIVDSEGCTTSSFVFISEPDTISLNLTGINTTGFGTSDGSASVETSGGTPDYSYEWENVDDPGIILSTDDSLEDIPAGTYSVTVTDENACSASDEITITQPTPLTHTISHTDNICYGGTTGTAEVTASGGVPGYTYVWQNEDGNIISNQSQAENLAAGTYYVTVIDSNGYTSNGSVTITQPQAISYFTNYHYDVVCNGDSTGSVSLNVSGGTPPFNLEWTNADAPGDVLSTSGTLSNIPAGDYMLNVEDQNGCLYDTSITITQPPPFEVLLDNQQDVECFGDAAGYLTVDVSGATPGYSYIWLDSDNQVIGATDSIGDLLAGDYYLLVTDSESCGSDTNTFTVMQPDNITFNAQIDSVSCYGGTDGMIDLNPTGGTIPYSYEWAQGGNIIAGADEDHIENLGYGIYHVTITDDNSCTYDTTLIVGQPDSPITFIVGTGNDVTCYGYADGSIDFLINGGTPYYTIQWETAGNSGILSDLTAGEATLSGLVAGTYYATLTDAYGCMLTDNVEITQPDEIETELTGTDIDCFGYSTGSITAQASGGNGNYSYAWDGGTPSPNNTYENIPAGWHYLTVTDAAGCTAEDSILLEQAPELIITMPDSLFLDCYGDTDAYIQPQLSGGTLPYNGEWTDENGDMISDIIVADNLGVGWYYLDVLDGNSCPYEDSIYVYEPQPLIGEADGTPPTCHNFQDGVVWITMYENAGTATYAYQWDDNSASQTDSVFNLGEGWYHVTVTDANGCSFTDSTEIVQPNPLTVSFETTDVICNVSAGAVDATIAGGTPPYNFYWSTGATTADITQIAAGLHYLTITDLNGCVLIDSIIINTIGNIHPDIVQTSDILCYGDATGAADILINDGTYPYSYLWSTDDTTKQISGLVEGDYYASVTDDWGCIGNDSIYISQPPEIILDLAIDHVLCRGDSTGAVQAVPTGGTGAFSFEWSTGETINPISNLPAGSYFITATDANGCTITELFSINQPDSILSGSALTMDITCFGYNNGKATARGFGGTPPYSYHWEGPNDHSFDFQTTPSNLFPGFYYVTITDSHACTYDTVVVITQPDPLHAAITEYGGPSCNGNTDAYIEIDSIVGGIPPYWLRINGMGISWDQSGHVIDSIPAGVYVIDVYDANNCHAEGAALYIEIDESNEPCLKIPKAFSPNGDGYNDRWVIDHLELFPNVLIQVYNRWGQLLYEGTYGTEFWDGTYEGNPVPTGPYIFYIDLNTAKMNPISGTVTIIR